MSFTVEHSYQTKDTLVFHIVGEFKGINLLDFENDMLTEIKFNKAKTVVFDLVKVGYLDSSAIEFLYRCNKACKELGQVLRIVNPSANIRKLFQILRLDKVILVD